MERLMRAGPCNMQVTRSVDRILVIPTSGEAGG